MPPIFGGVEAAGGSREGREGVSGVMTAAVATSVGGKGSYCEASSCLARWGSGVLGARAS
ncbi:MAG: hypothetical protein ACRD2Z_07850 [Thermoanaerobaculia bacterium]